MRKKNKTKKTKQNKKTVVINNIINSIQKFLEII